MCALLSGLYIGGDHERGGGGGGVVVGGLAKEGKNVSFKFFRLGQFLSNYWSYRVIFGTCEVFVFRSVSQ